MREFISENIGNAVYVIMVIAAAWFFLSMIGSITNRTQPHDGIPEVFPGIHRGTDHQYGNVCYFSDSGYIFCMKEEELK